MGDMDNFTATIHHKIHAAIDPALRKLPGPFVACVIGASTGIGEHIAYAYALAGATGIAISARQTSGLQRVATHIHSINQHIQVEVVECDITSSKSVSVLSSVIRAKFGRLDVVIPNAGYAGPPTQTVTEGSPAWFQQNFDVNTVGPYHAAHHLIPLLLESENGARSFFCVGSTAACLVKGSVATGYCISKFAQSRLIEHLGEQFGEKGLVAINIHPGGVLTPTAEEHTPLDFQPYLVDSIDLCGAFCVWLSSQPSTDLKWLTGRFISDHWDIAQLLEKKEEIVSRDLLKWKFSM